MNRIRLDTPASVDYAGIRRRAEAMRNAEVARLLGAGAERVARSLRTAIAIARGTLARVRSAGAWTFFGSH